MLNYLADLIFINGQVVTVDQNNYVAQALAIKGNKIVCVGTDDQVQELAGPETRIIDLEGRSLLPGFIDSHMHFAEYGTNELGVDCSYPNVKCIEDIKQQIKQVTAHTPKGRWIRGYGYDHTKLNEKRHPNRWDLDEAAPDHPVVLMRACGHISANNGLALKLFGITDNISDTGNGLIERVDGKPNGVLKESAYLDSVKTFAYSHEELVETMGIASRNLTRMGITSIHDAGAYGDMQMKAMQEAVENGSVKTRIYAMVFAYSGNLEFARDVINTGEYTGWGNERLKLGALKVTMVDGASSGPTAATREPYISDPDFSGILYLSQQELDELCLRGHLAGFQVTAHVVGDKAVEMYLDAIEKALKVKPKKDHRHRIEHCFMVDPQLISRVRELEVVPISQPVFFNDFGDEYFANYGEKRVRYAFPCKSYMNAGIVTAGSSDCPVTTPDPIFGIHMAVNRVTAGGRIAAPEERVSLIEAIRMYTINGAYASFEEGIKGSLEVGKLADMVVLSGPILNFKPERIKDIKVEMTVIDGEVVFPK